MEHGLRRHRAGQRADRSAAAHDGPEPGADRRRGPVSPRVLLLCADGPLWGCADRHLDRAQGERARVARLDLPVHRVGAVGDPYRAAFDLYDHQRRSRHQRRRRCPPGQHVHQRPRVQERIRDEWKRRRMFLVGPQVNLETLQPAETRDHKPLVFDTAIANVTAATEGEGPRIYKWPIDKAHVAQNNGNDFAWFRVAEMYLIQAEALNEQTPGSATALGLLNTVRARTVPVATPLGGPITRDLILSERLFELNS